MNVLIIGAGLVGSTLARQLRADGHHVTTTTTTPAKVETLLEFSDNAVVLRGTDAEAVATAVKAADAVVVTAGPSAERSMTPEDRAAHYKEILVDTAANVMAAVEDQHVIGFSSNVVYGNDADVDGTVTEESPLTSWADPSPQNFQAAERVYTASGNACVFRCPEMHGDDEMELEDKVKMAHSLLKGSVPFRAEALFYQLHASRAAAAAKHAIEQRLTGIYNLVPTEVPPSNAEVFDGISVELGLPPLEYRGELPGPAVPISGAKLAATGFTI